MGQCAERGGLGGDQLTTRFPLTVYLVLVLLLDPWRHLEVEGRHRTIVEEEDDDWRIPWPLLELLATLDLDGPSHVSVNMAHVQR